MRLHPLHSGGRLTDAFVGKGVSVVGTANAGGRMSRLLSLASTIRSARPLVHSFLPEAYLFGASLGLMFGARSVVMSRRSRNHYQSRHPFAAWVERRLHRRMDALLGNSQAVVRDLLDEGAPPERVRLIYNGIDVGRFAAGGARLERRHALRAELGLPDDRVVLACVANLFLYKGHADLLAALASLGAGFAARTTLLLVGRDAGARAALEAQAARLGLSASVRFLGERGDVPDLLAASDIGVLASHEEGFSNAVLEGMAAGLPVVVSDVGGNAEAVTDGECGHVVPARAPAALAQALADLIGDAGRRQTMGAAARRRVAASFSLDACVAAYESLYEELWSRRLAAARRK
ncbi:MAG: glycosyltransferase [Candidatus Accumulibacter sp.]|uniref:glycosyltransferase n=1 Tax=Accumulibacter sp. TaxID=2053492 RepID=UPI0028781FE5|nr:glycosyltransferase [Accumulibacter sp.]MDS4016638.1 glycosyltransferase [Accumulibacter sp.]